MRVMILAKSSPESENAAPSQEGWEPMARFQQELADAGVLLGSERLQPTAKGKRVRFKGKDRHVIDGPFMESKELVAGYWLWQVDAFDEAIDWIKRAPFPDGMEVEIRPLEEMQLRAAAGGQ
jgi:hypothetical protein